MGPVPRHQCLIYDGAPSRQLPALAAVTREKLEQNYRCFYLNSRPMVAGMRSYLAAAGVDVAQAMERRRLVLSSEQSHLIDGRFDVDQMMHTLEDGLHQALAEGYTGLWATGDMTWEMGSQRDFSKLLEYEWRLEEFFRRHPEMGGVCQYHMDTLPPDMTRQGLLAHPSIFINETLSLINSHYMHPDIFRADAFDGAELDVIISCLCQPGRLS